MGGPRWPAPFCAESPSLLCQWQQLHAYVGAGNRHACRAETRRRVGEQTVRDRHWNNRLVQAGQIHCLRKRWIGAENTEVACAAAHDPCRPACRFPCPHSGSCSTLSVRDLRDVEALWRFDCEADRVHGRRVAESGRRRPEIIRLPIQRIPARIEADDQLVAIEKVRRRCCRVVEPRRDCIVDIRERGDLCLRGRRSEEHRDYDPCKTPFAETHADPPVNVNRRQGSVPPPSGLSACRPALTILKERRMASLLSVVKNPGEEKPELGCPGPCRTCRPTSLPPSASSRRPLRVGAGLQPRPRRGLKAAPYRLLSPVRIINCSWGPTPTRAARLTSFARRSRRRFLL
jgi:hypothetical protein